MTLAKCVWCGHETNNDVMHYTGVIGSVCKYSKCQSKWQNFKYRIKNYKKSKYPDVREFAFVVEQKVMEQKEPAILWNDQLLSIRRLQDKLPLQRPVIELRKK